LPFQALTFPQTAAALIVLSFPSNMINTHLIAGVDFEDGLGFILPALVF
jgi:hypothetical protein